MKFTSKLMFTAVPILVLFSIAAAGPAQAVSSESPSPTDLNQIRTTMASVGIDSNTQDSLIAKLQAHQPLDSMTGAQQIRTFTEDLVSSMRTYKVFQDGSRSWIDLEKSSPSGGVAARSAMTNCSTSGAWKVNC
ncbi:hypothetical protein ATY41_08675 [Leifsonia xyli subsp. xyli]|uniref:Secreted protein n=1 Tax=Leifsonia xyli subsp. xyli TaxID=59736 RepID=A0A1E2SLI6_LEIXY|nr:hypothetical protein [Leifsonia xyli]ODA90715.1 hypothetical protein ATY41_08675 [Leifsonia xyli subsp. xyli]